MRRSGVGRYALCSHGRIGVVQEIQKKSEGMVYLGMGVFDGARWQSIKPRFLSIGDQIAITDVLVFLRKHNDKTTI